MYEVLREVGVEREGGRRGGEEGKERGKGGREG